MTRIVVISDLHLDQSTAGVDRYDDVADVLWLATKHAMDIRADGFLFLGDLADPHTARSHRAVNALGACIHKLAVTDHVTEIGVLVGNHDVIEDGSGRTVLDVMRWCGGTRVFLEPTVTTFAGVDLIALPFTPTSRNYDPDAFIREAACTFKPTSTHPPLVIGHLNLEGITPGSETTDMPRGRDVYWPIEALDECFPDALLLGGHYHVPQTFGRVRIVGSAVRLRFDEADGSPGFITLEI